MAKPKPTKVELANCMAKLYAVEGMTSPSKLESWEGLSSLARSKSSGSIPLGDLAKPYRSATSPRPAHPA